jgi:hypothetical protein
VPLDRQKKKAEAGFDNPWGIFDSIPGRQEQETHLRMGCLSPAAGRFVLVELCLGYRFRQSEAMHADSRQPAFFIRSSYR